MRFLKIFLRLGAFLILSSTVWADIPNLINFQGSLTDTSGNPVKDSTYSVAFTIYDAAASGANLWSETQSVTTKDGIFNVYLGSVTTLPITISDDTTRYLGIQMGSDPEMTPRQRIVSMAYGYRVRTVDGATGGVISGDVDIQSDLTVSGKVGVGTTTPTADLHVVSTQPSARMILESSVANGNPTILVKANTPAGCAAFFADRADAGCFASFTLLTAGSTNWNLYVPPGSDRFDITSATTPRFTILQDGRVGIGTTSPNEQLEITGNLRLPASTASVGAIKSGANRFIHNFGTNNFFAGVNAGNLTLSGSGSNTGVGFNALLALTTGYSNTAVGKDALYNNTTGGANTAVGQSALGSNTTGGDNTAMGYFAFYSNTTGGNNTAMGKTALYNNTTGYSNTAVGQSALYSNTTASGNTAVGKFALSSNTTGAANTAVGDSALAGNTTGPSNTAMGYQALKSTTTASINTAVGHTALYSNTTGGANTAMGYQALYLNTTANSNTAVGANTLLNTTGAGNTAVGYGAFSNNGTGTNNTAIGYSANVSAGALTNATAIGYAAVVAASNALVLGGTGANAVNVGIGTTSPQGALDVTSTTGAFIVPRMTTAQRDALTAVNGMIIYNTTTDQFNFREAGAWVTK